MPVAKEKSEEEYPKFSLWSPEAVKAVFGSKALKAGEEITLPLKLRVCKVTAENERGTTNVEVEIVAAGNPSKSAKYTEAEEEDEYEEEDEA
jgi:hypothetical protein